METVSCVPTNGEIAAHDWMRGLIDVKWASWENTTGITDSDAPHC